MLPPRAAYGRPSLLFTSACIALVFVASCSRSVEDGAVIEIPSIFDQHRVLVRPVTTDGDTLLFYTDTGGGLDRIYEPVVDRLGLRASRMALGSDSVSVTTWPEWRQGAWLPSPDTLGPLAGGLLIVPVDEAASRIHDSATAGFLGRLWFADRVWTFDYPAQRLLFHSVDSIRVEESKGGVLLGFQVDSAGRRTMHFPSIRIAVAGDSLDLLFDTGATVTLTESALAIVGDGGPARRASSFISAAVFDGWRAEHQDWRVVERATGFDADLIQVPRITIGEHEVGPVWFERRPAGVFEKQMSRWMDREIVGALGGNALRFFRVTVDYPNARATFDLPER